MNRRILGVAIVLMVALLPPLTLTHRVRAAQETLRFVQKEVLLRLSQKPLLVHSKRDGWAELPALEMTPGYAYVAYDVRRDYESHVHVARIPLDGEGEVEDIEIDHDGEIEFAPSIVALGDGIWIVWTSYRQGRWAIRASRLDGMMVVRTLTLFEGEAFSSQARAVAGDGKLAVAWIEYGDKEFAIRARFLSDGADDTLTIYRSATTVSRPDLCSLGEGEWAFVWDEFLGGRYVTRIRRMKDGCLEEIRPLSSPDAGNAWEAHVVANAAGVLMTWHRVPEGLARTQPALALSDRLWVEDGIDRKSYDETWRVRAFADRDSSLWIAWLTRRMYRSTQLYLRRVDEDGLSEICRVEFPMRKNFINWFDMEVDGSAAIVWEYSGSIYFGEFKLPRLRTKAVPPDTTGRLLPPPRIPKRVNYSIDYQGEHLRVYVGDYHNHTSFSDGRAYPDISINFARYRRGLDFFCITDHDITLTPGEFVWTRAIARALSDDGTFVCLHGYEPSKGWAQQGYGHWNMLYFDGGDVFQYKEGMTPHDLHAYAKAHDAVLIPHHVAKRFAPYAWGYFDEEAQPVVEMCSIHGIFEMYEGHENDRSMVEGKFIQDGLAKGYRFGFVGASDYHNCFVSLLQEYGLTGIYAPSLTREGIHEALKKRRTYALTGGGIVVDFRCNGHLMGEEIEADGDLTFTAYAASPDSITTAEIISWGKTVYRKDFGRKAIRFEYTTGVPATQTYFYLRVRTAKGDFAWSSPIWITPSR